MPSGCSNSWVETIIKILIIAGIVVLVFVLVRLGLHKEATSCCHKLPPTNSGPFPYMSMPMPMQYAPVGRPYGAAPPQSRPMMGQRTTRGAAHVEEADTLHSYSDDESIEEHHTSYRSDDY
jgi:hypothetical protein